MLACSWFASAPSVPEVEFPPVVALITIDTWRADHLDPRLTPHLWALAAAGERYTDAWSPIGLTTPAHATMMTGRFPWEHGVEGNNHHGYTLGPDLQVLPEQYSGWARGAFVSAYPAGPAGGLARGWEVYEGPSSGERPGEEAVAQALAWLPTDRPALLMVHVYEPHGPYIGRGDTERERYGEEVSRADAALAPLLQALQARGARIVVTADHGEVLDEERCSYQHERSISDHVLRVPMIRWAPDLQPAVIDARVGLTDVRRLLAGESVPGRPHWLAESGMCEADCAPGCAPRGLSGRDRVVIGAGGRWVDRPGRGRFSVGSPSAALAGSLDEIPAVAPPAGLTSEAARSLGYLDGPF
jgi:arylsulfatase A-like enzyme